MNTRVNLLEGSITGSLAKLAFPIMGTSLIQMAYNMVDMIWIGRISSDAVAAVGAAGMYMWLANGVTTIPRMGGQVSVGQSLGAGDIERAANYARGALRIGVFLGLLYGLVCLVFHGLLIDFFRLNSSQVIRNAEIYLMITCGAIVFAFLNQILAGILTAMGSTAITFRATTVGLVINLVLDPLLIFGPGFLPRLEVTGAALATVIAQIVVFAIFLFTVWHDPLIFRRLHITRRSERTHIRELLRIGFPAAVQDVLFTGISMLIARMVAGWGDAAVAVQKVGGQIESISWMCAGGFSTAVNAFIAQNYGAGKKDRIKKGLRVSFLIIALWGIFSSFLLIAFPEFFFRIFIPEKDVIPMGAEYLRVIGISEFFICTELTAAGAFQGFGKTVPPSISGVFFNVMRIPTALFLSASTLGLSGIWWALTLTSICKGLVLPVWFFLFFARYYKSDSDISNRIQI